MECQKQGDQQVLTYMSDIQGILQFIVTLVLPHTSADQPLHWSLYLMFVLGLAASSLPVLPAGGAEGAR